MQQWEYLVLSLRDGAYTSTLNGYGRDGWELVAVVNDVPPPAEEPATTPSRPRLPIPGVATLGRIEDAANMVGRIGGGAQEQAAPDPGPSSLLWVLRRPIAAT